MPLYQDSGQTDDRRDQEANDILGRMISEDGEWMIDLDHLDARSRDFLISLRSRKAQYGRLRFIRPQALYWLRDLYAKM